ncbi:MAG TPA: Rieske 2Fe-2S domain-containing protein [Longimicrobiales bacterium]|nr:Rieske 2Fe-2S domain-containing protein [Longimicrobiales bacterium]
MASFETVLRTPDLGPGAVREVEVHGRRLAVANVGQTYYALAARCPVDGTNLATDGRIEGDALVCPNDEARFDVRTGRQLDGDGELAAHAIRVEGNQVLVGPPRDGDGTTGT